MHTLTRSLTQTGMVFEARIFRPAPALSTEDVCTLRILTPASAAPLVRVIVKFTVNFAVCNGLGHREFD